MLLFSQSRRRKRGSQKSKWKCYMWRLLMMSKCTRWQMCDNRRDIGEKKCHRCDTVWSSAMNASWIQDQAQHHTTPPSVPIFKLLLSFCVQWLLPCKDSLPWHYKYPLVYTTAYPAAKRQPGWLVKEEDWRTSLLLCCFFPCNDLLASTCTWM